MKNERNFKKVLSYCGRFTCFPTSSSCVFVCLFEFLQTINEPQKNYVTDMFEGPNKPSYYSRDAHIWSECHCYPSSVHNSYPAIYVGCQDPIEILQIAAEPQFFSLQNPFCLQFVE